MVNSVEVLYYFNNYNMLTNAMSELETLARSTFVPVPDI